MAYYHDRQASNDVGMLNSLFNVVMVAGLLGFAVIAAYLVG
jgi:hypothetical protein